MECLLLVHFCIVYFNCEISDQKEPTFKIVKSLTKKKRNRNGGIRNRCRTSSKWIFDVEKSRFVIQVYGS